MTNPRLRVQVRVTAPSWKRAAAQPAPWARAAARAAFDAARVQDEEAKRFSISVLLAGREKMRRLNKRFRGRDETTDVLAFPDGTLLENGERILGDLALGYEPGLRSARNFGVSARAQLAHLVAHGTLHLLGIHHRNRGEERAMRALERDALARLGLPDPWNMDAARPDPARRARAPGKPAVKRP